MVAVAGDEDAVNLGLIVSMTETSGRVDGVNGKAFGGQVVVALGSVMVIEGRGKVPLYVGQINQLF